MDVADLKLGLDATWMRSDIARGIEAANGKPRVDRENRIIHGFAVATKGEAKGHDVLLDDLFLNQVVTQGAMSKAGIKMRFDHPNASNTSMGTSIGRAKNFRRDGDVVRADAHLLKAAEDAPNGNLSGYVMDLAEEDPGLFGSSIAFIPDKVEFQLDDKGKPDRTKKPFARLKKLLAADIVDDPAANPDGMFSREDSLAAKATAFMTRWSEHNLMPQLQAFFATIKEELMSEVTMTDAQLEEIKSKYTALGKKEGAKDERERVAGINKAFASVWGEKVDAKEFRHRDELIALGISAETAETEFKVRKLRMLGEEAPKSAGGGDEPDHKPKVDLSKLTPEERYKAEWEASKEIQEDMGGNFEVYAAYRKAEDNGQMGLKNLDAKKAMQTA